MRHMCVSQPTNKGTDVYEQPPRRPNGIHSKTLTVLQSGYLLAMSTLEARNNALQQELDQARAAPRSSDQAIRQMALDQASIKALQQELNKVRTAPGPIDLANMQVAQRNARLQMQATQRIVHLEQRNSLLSRDWDAFRSQQAVSNSQVQDIEDIVAKKNQTIKERNSRIIDLEHENRQLHAKLAAAENRNKDKGRVISESRKRRKFNPPPGSQGNPLEL